MKFAGRKQPRFFPRLLRRSSVLGNTPTFAATAIALGLAGFLALGWVIVALLGAVQGGSVWLPFTFAASHAAADAGVGGWFAGAILVLGLVWSYPARQFRRQPFDGLFAALVVVEFFSLIRWLGMLSSPSEVPSWASLALGEKSNLILAMLLLCTLLAAWMLRPKRGKSYQLSGPTRITDFLKKRRRRMLFIGGFLIALAVVGGVGTALAAFGGDVVGLYRENGYELALEPPLAIGIFVVCDLVYLLGRYYWYRLT